VVAKYPFAPITLEQAPLVNKRASACQECPALIPEAQYELEVGTEASAVVSGSKTPRQGADDSAAILERILKDFGYK
jgi:hypothetical protein